ncbi:unnamed protein product [Urochloa humidicola]
MEATAEELAGAENGKGEDAAGRLTYEIFSLLEAKFLFGGRPAAAAAGGAGKVCVLSIDGGARLSDGLLAAAALVRLEAALRRLSGSPAARLADFFDVAAGSGAGGVLAALLFARGPRGRPLYTAEDALAFLLRRVRRRRGAAAAAWLRRGGAAAFGKALGELTLRDTVRPVLVPCYDLATRAPFLFSGAAAAESAAHDFRLRDVCAATTCAAGGGAAVEVVSVDGGGGGTRVRAVGGGAALGNPTAAAITHVLNNRREFPAASAIDDLLVISIGTGDAAGGRAKAPEVARIAAEGVSDMVDQAVAMAFGQSRTSNYVRIQGTGSRRGGGGRAPRACGGETREQAVWKAEAMLLQRSVESVLFQGRKLAGETNADKLERFARELAKEHARRKQRQQAVEQASSGDGGAPPVASSATPKPQTPAKLPHIREITSPSPAAAAATAAGSTEAGAPRRRRRSALPQC